MRMEKSSTTYHDQSLLVWLEVAEAVAERDDVRFACKKRTVGGTLLLFGSRLLGDCGLHHEATAIDLGEPREYLKA